ncbi:ABC transporter permease subunit [Arthrobacter sp. zg-Y411]|uniref:ABC transporter permease n=1 Tax=Arthrobacter zhangbolii TaxID=2886936 RepID=UPI001D1443C3|nr:ABC transporter permease subunit [Arthrobacter zhangbolii]MCC3293205.1 ABC transporter permease subunit [Arthrobacter zhangbolii]
MTSSPTATTAPGTFRRASSGLGWTLVLPLIIVIVWAVIAAVMDSAVFPSPRESFQRLTEDLARPDFRASIWSTVQLLLLGWLLAVAVGTLVGFALGLSNFWSSVFSTPLFALYSIPKVTLYPVFLLFLGIGDSSRLAFAFFHGVFPIALLVMAATQSMDKNLLKLAKVLVMPWHVRLRSILIPALLPAIVTALRIAFGLTLLGLILAEMFSAESGLGRELVSNVANVRIDRIAGQVVFIAIIAVIPGFALRWMERRVTQRYGT